MFGDTNKFEFFFFPLFLIDNFIYVASILNYLNLKMMNINFLRTYNTYQLDQTHYILHPFCSLHSSSLLLAHFFPLNLCCPSSLSLCCTSSFILLLVLIATVWFFITRFDNWSCSCFKPQIDCSSSTPTNPHARASNHLSTIYRKSKDIEGRGGSKICSTSNVWKGERETMSVRI